MEFQCANQVRAFRFRAAHKYYLRGSMVVLYFIKARYNLLSKKKHARYNLYKAFRIPTQLRKLKKRGINDKD